MVLYVVVFWLKASRRPPGRAHPVTAWA
jgi:hypothetical protein